MHERELKPWDVDWLCLSSCLGLVAVLFWAGVHNLRHRRALAESNHVTLIPASPATDNSGPPDAEGYELRGKPRPHSR